MTIRKIIQPKEVTAPAEPLLLDAIRNGLASAQRTRAEEPRHYIRPSDSGKCARAASYTALGVEGETMDLTGMWNVRLGSLIHEVLQGFLDADCEVPVHSVSYDGTIIPATIELSDGTTVPVVGYADVVLDDTVVDFKSKGGFGYKLMLGVGNSEPEGCDINDMLQAGIYALAFGKKSARVAYIAKEVISTGLANRNGLDEASRFYVEFERQLDDEFRAEIESELARLYAINRLALDESTLATRKIPGIPVEIDDPNNGSWAMLDDDGNPIMAGSAWQCAYCPYQRRCINDGPGRVKL